MTRTFKFSGLLFIAMSFLPATPAWSEDFTLDQLMPILAAHGSSQAAYTEKKYLAVLDAPLESSGELVYLAPDHIEKNTLRPKPESLVVDGDVLQLKSGKRKHTLQLSAYPEIAAFVESIRGTLAGDRAALEKVYALKLDGDAAHWQLELKPADAKLAATITRIVMTGAQGVVTRVEVFQADGDRSVMEIRNIHDINNAPHPEAPPPATAP